MSLTNARGRLRTLAILAAKLDRGRVPNRLSAYALLIEERPARRQDMLADLERSAQQSPHAGLVELLLEASAVVREVLKGNAGDAPQPWGRCEMGGLRWGTASRV